MNISRCSLVLSILAGCFFSMSVSAQQACETPKDCTMICFKGSTLECVKNLCQCVKNNS